MGQQGFQVTGLTAETVDALLSRQDIEFREDFSAANSLLHSVVSGSPEEDLFAAGSRELGSEDPRRRILGVRLIRELKEYRAEATAALTKMMGHERDSAVLYWIVSAFGFLKSDSVAERLRQLAEDTDPGIRYEVATALANPAGSELPAASLEVLLALCRDINPEVRFSAVFELGSWWLINHDPRIESVLRRAALEDEDGDVADAARYALAGRQP
jgi:HEAT repeat protein